jgi:hypothetical protein
MTDIKRRMLTHTKWSTTPLVNDAQAEGDKKPAANDTSDGDGYGGNRATLEDAAESAYRKCVNELETGSKTRTDQDDICPRKKFNSVDKHDNVSPRNATLSSPAAVLVATKTMIMDDTSHSSSASVTSARERSTNKRVVPTSSTLVQNNSDGTGQNRNQGRCNKEDDDPTSTNAIKGVVGDLEKSVAVSSSMNNVLPSTTTTSSTAQKQPQQQHPRHLSFNETLRAAGSMDSMMKSGAGS